MELLRSYEETGRELEQMNKRLDEVAEQAGPVSEHEAVLTEADMPQQDKAALLRRAKEKDNQAAKRLQAEAAKARSTARGADQRAAYPRGDGTANSTWAPARRRRGVRVAVRPEARVLVCRPHHRGFPAAVSAFRGRTGRTVRVEEARGAYASVTKTALSGIRSRKLSGMVPISQSRCVACTAPVGSFNRT